MIAIAFCQEGEWNKYINSLQVIYEEKVHGVDIYEIETNKFNYIILAMGSGKVNIGFALGKMLEKYDIDVIIGLGNCASFMGQDMNIGRVAISECAVQSDVDYTSIGYGSNQVPGLEKAYYYANKKLIDIATKYADLEGYEYKIGNFVSLDSFVANGYLASKLSLRYDAQYLDNECGDIGEIAILTDIPYVCIKGISNYANDCAMSDYKEYMEDANEKAFNIVFDMLEEVNMEFGQKTEE